MSSSDTSNSSSINSSSDPTAIAAAATAAARQPAGAAIATTARSLCKVRLQRDKGGPPHETLDHRRASFDGDTWTQQQQQQQQQESQQQQQQQESQQQQQQHPKQHKAQTNSVVKAQCLRTTDADRTAAAAAAGAAAAAAAAAPASRATAKAAGKKSAGGVKMEPTPQVEVDLKTSSSRRSSLLACTYPWPQRRSRINRKLVVTRSECAYAATAAAQPCVSARETPELLLSPPEDQRAPQERDTLAAARSLP
ncbi:hypothetical protein Emed_001587 [Eimeria media]